MRGAIEVMELMFEGSSARAGAAKANGAKAAKDRNDRRLYFELNTLEHLTYWIKRVDSLILVNGALIMAVAEPYLPI